MQDSGELVAIWLKRRRRGPMDEVPQADVRAGQGLVNNTDRRGKRQVTFLDLEHWKSVTVSIGAELGPVARRANLLLSGIRLEATRGRVLVVGDCRFRVNGETTPCERMEEAFPGLEGALRPSWGGGAFGEALDDGEITVGDRVYWEV